MSFKAVHIQCNPEWVEILIARFSVYPFETFEETDKGFSAYISSDIFNEKEISALLDDLSARIKSHSIEEIQRENWNQTWEKNYDPVFVDDKVAVRAIFHVDMPEYKYQVIINPKMSFGTGHHATTHLMIKMILELQHEGKMVADFGTGTGVLGIMAGKLHAKEILVTDIDDWCIENSTENFGLNGISNVKFLQGSVLDLNISTTFDIIFANINKNVLLEEMSEYVRLLKEGGKILFSGFYEEDISDMENSATQNHLRLLKNENKDSWSALLFEKIR